MTLINYLDYAHVRVFGFSIIRFFRQEGVNLLCRYFLRYFLDMRKN